MSEVEPSLQSTNVLWCRLLSLDSITRFNKSIAHSIVPFFTTWYVNELFLSTANFWPRLVTNLCFHLLLSNSTFLPSTVELSTFHSFLILFLSIIFFSISVHFIRSVARGLFSYIPVVDFFCGSIFFQCNNFLLPVRYWYRTDLKPMSSTIFDYFWPNLWNFNGSSRLHTMLNFSII